jgi:hypothetical protein
VAGVGQVFVVGAAPTWPISGVVHIPETDPYEHNKDANIIRKMVRVCKMGDLLDDSIFRLSAPFLFVNDDHYFSQDCRAGEFPYYHKGELKAVGVNREYIQRLANTRRLLAAWGLPILNYDVHTPVLIHQQKFLEVFSVCDWMDLAGPGMVMKSVYVNSRPELAGEYLPDCKLTVKTGGNVNFWVEKLRERPCWSSGNHVTRLVWEILERLYPEPSSYEQEMPR